MFMYKNQHTFSYINCKLMLLVLEPKFAAYLWEYKTIIYRTLLIIINKDYSKLTWGHLIVGRHIFCDRLRTVKLVYKPVEKVTVRCFLIKAKKIKLKKQPSTSEKLYVVLYQVNNEHVSGSYAYKLVSYFRH